MNRDDYNEIAARLTRIEGMLATLLADRPRCNLMTDEELRELVGQQRLPLTPVKKGGGPKCG